jgi:hypothetical protein
MFFTLLHYAVKHKPFNNAAFTAVNLTELAALFPDNIIPDYRKKRSYISALLSKNEIDSANTYNKKLFKRTRTGHYFLNSNLAIRQKDEWINIFEHANINLTANLGIKSDAGSATFF